MPAVEYFAEEILQVIPGYHGIHLRALQRLCKSPSLRCGTIPAPTLLSKASPAEDNAVKPAQSEDATLDSLGLVLSSIAAWPKDVQAFRRLDRISAGASLATLMQLCISDSGIFRMYARGGGSADIKHLKLSCASSLTISRRRSSCGTQLCIKWQFCNITQPPVFAKAETTASAGFSCPCPMDMLRKVPASSVIPNSFPSP